MLLAYRHSLCVTGPAGVGLYFEEGFVAVRLRAWSSLGGIAFTVLAVVGSIFLYDGPQDSSPARMAAWYGRSSNRTHIDIGWVLTGLALLCLIWFVAGVRERVAVAEQADTPGASFLSSLIGIGGTVFVAAGVCQIGIAGGIKTMSDDTYHHQVYSGVIHAAGDASYVILAGSGIAMASMILAISLAIFAFGLLPRWVGWFGGVAGVAAIFSLFFFTMLVWLLWLAVASVMLYRRSSHAAVARDALATA
jgi:hypothetical protein